MECICFRSSRLQIFNLRKTTSPPWCPLMCFSVFLICLCSPAQHNTLTSAAAVIYVCNKKSAKLWRPVHQRRASQHSVCRVPEVQHILASPSICLHIRLTCGPVSLRCIAVCRLFGQTSEVIYILSLCIFASLISEHSVKMAFSKYSTDISWCCSSLRLCTHGDKPYVWVKLKCTKCCIVTIQFSEIRYMLLIFA